MVCGGQLLTRLCGSIVSNINMLAICLASEGEHERAIISIGCVHVHVQFVAIPHEINACHSISYYINTCLDLTLDLLRAWPRSPIHKRIRIRQHLVYLFAYNYAGKRWSHIDAVSAI